jgi:hypothetical protein
MKYIHEGIKKFLFSLFFAEMIKNGSNSYNKKIQEISSVNKMKRDEMFITRFLLISF